MKTTAAILSFVCLVIHLQSCYGLRCHSCNLKEDSEPECNNIVDDRFLIECKQGENCGQLIKKKKDGRIEVLRSCFANDVLENLNNSVELLDGEETDVDFVICDVDKCNGKLQLNDLIVPS